MLNIGSFRRRTPLKAAAVAAVAALGLAGCAGDSGTTESTGDETYTFTLATGALDGTPHSAIEQHYLDLVEERSDGRIEFERTTFEALCAQDEVVDCVRDGRADIGTTVTDFTPHLLPTLSVVSISFLSTDIQATVAALYDTHTTYDPAVELLENNNLHYIATWPVGTMLIGANEPVETYEDLNGLRARAAGPVTQASLETAGVNVNAITAGETYESIQRGVIDSVAAPLDFAVNFNIIEQAGYWVDPGLGQYTAYGMWWNKDSYDSLPEDLQAVVDEITEEMNLGGQAVETYNNQMRTVCDRMLESNDVESFTSWDDSETEKWRDAVAADAEAQWTDIVSGFNLEDPQSYLDAYKASYDSFESDDNPLDAGPSCIAEWQELHN